jgi:hypothetical protein
LNSTSERAQRQGQAEDVSFIIDTKSTQMASCPHCFEEMGLAQLRRHLHGGTSSLSCPNQNMTCPEEGCLAIFPAKGLKRHLLKECLATKKRRALIEKGDLRKKLEADMQRQKAIDSVSLAIESKRIRLTMALKEGKKGEREGGEEGEGDIAEENGWWGRGGSALEGGEEKIQKEIKCEDCGERVRPSKLRGHLSSSCPYREIYCSNRPLGNLSYDPNPNPNPNPNPSPKH